MGNIYVQFDGTVYQQIVGIPMGTNCAPLIADLFLYCYERDFMSDLQKSKRFDLIDMFNDTSRYLDDIFTIDNPEFEKHIPDIYPAELQLNKANTSDKETSFLDLNIKVIGSDIHTRVYDKRDDFGFPIVNFPWLSGDVPRLPSYGIYISQLVRFARCCTSVLDFHSKNLQITSKLLTQSYKYDKFRKTFGKFFRSYPEFAEHIPEIYPRELQLNKANTSDKETSYLDLNIKVVGSNIHTSVYDKRDDFGFPIVNFPWLSGDVPRLPSYGIYISHILDIKISIIYIS